MAIDKMLALLSAMIIRVEHLDKYQKSGLLFYGYSWHHSIRILWKTTDTEMAASGLSSVLN